MSILTDVLQEELDRLERQKVVYERDLQDLQGREDAFAARRREQLHSSLQRVAEDRIRLKRALAPIDPAELPEWSE